MEKERKLAEAEAKKAADLVAKREEEERKRMKRQQEVRPVQKMKPEKLPLKKHLKKLHCELKKQLQN